MNEVVDVDDVRRRLAALREGLGEADDVVLDHHLGVSRDEDVERGLPRGEAEREGAPGDRGEELEETAAWRGGLRKARRIGLLRRHLGRDPEGLPAGARLRGDVRIEPGADGLSRAVLPGRGVGLGGGRRKGRGRLGHRLVPLFLTRRDVQRRARRRWRRGATTGAIPGRSPGMTEARGLGFRGTRVAGRRLGAGRSGARDAGVGRAVAFPRTGARCAARRGRSGACRAARGHLPGCYQEKRRSGAKRQ